MTNNYFDNININLEQSFTSAACISKDMNCIEESQLAAKRVFSYNPNSKKILNLFPQYAPIIEQISALVGSHGKSLKNDPNNNDLWTILGYCYLTLGDFPNAFAAYAHALRISQNSRDPNFWYAMGIVYEHYKYHDSAQDCFRKVFEFNPSFQFATDIFFRLGLIFRTLNDFDTAIAYFDKVKNSPPNHLIYDDIQLQIAYTYQLQRSNDKAYKIYSDLHSRYPNSLQLTQQYCWFMYMQYKDTRISTVFDEVSKAIQKEPYDPTLQLIAARVAMKQDNMPTAYQHYKFCITYCNDSPYFWCGLGVLYFKNEQVEDAIVAFQRAVYIKKDLKEGWLNIGLIYEQQNDYENAKKIYQIGMQNCSSSEDFQDRLNSIASQGKHNFSLIDIDDTKFIVPIPEQFAIDYTQAVPELQPECYGIDIGIASKFAILSTYPKSIFST